MKKALSFEVLLCLLICMTLSSCNWFSKKTTKLIAKKSAKELTEEVAESSIEYGSKKTISKVLIKGLPALSKREAEIFSKYHKDLLKVTNINGRNVPVFNNLNSNSKLFSPALNNKVLQYRRSKCSPYHQFPTLSQLVGPELKATNGTSNAVVLRENLLQKMSKEARMRIEAFGGTAAHHIVEGTDQAANASREILKKFDIDINSAINGVFLPTDKNSIYKGALHKTSHSEAYSKYVYNQIKDVKSKDELVEKLINIKYDLYYGRLDLEKGVQIVNKNRIL